MLKEKAARFDTPMKTSADRKEIAAVYEYTMNQYRQSGDIPDAFTKGARQARSLFEANFSDRAGTPGSYSAKYDWDNFFDQSEYTFSPRWRCPQFSPRTAVQEVPLPLAPPGRSWVQ